MGIFSSSNPVLDLLKEDHRKVEQLFADFDKSSDGRTKSALVTRALHELEVHTTLEEELVYPAIRAALEEEDLMDEALEEHHVAHTLIDELKTMTRGEKRYDAKFTVLAENIRHHVKEEEGQMFPKAEDAEIDWERLHEQVVQLKDELLSQNHVAGKRQTHRPTKTRAISRSRRSQKHHKRAKAA